MVFVSITWPETSRGRGAFHWFCKESCEAGLACRRFGGTLERRPLFKADWQTMFLPSAMLAFLYYGDYLIDPKDLLWFDPLTALSFVFAPVMFAHAFHRMRGTVTA